MCNVDHFTSASLPHIFVSAPWAAVRKLAFWARLLRTDSMSRSISIIFLLVSRPCLGVCDRDICKKIVFSLFLGIVCASTQKFQHKLGGE